MYQPFVEENENHTQKKTFRYRESLKSPEKRRQYLRHWYKAISAQKNINYGRKHQGLRVYDFKKGARSSRTSLIAGYFNKKCLAPMLFSGTCNSEVFNEWFEKRLIPELPKNSVVVLDNETFHKSDYLKEIAPKYGVELLFLPPYSPELNPIEKLWANLKKFWRGNAHLTLDEMIVTSGFI
ncbi:transposase [Ignatzschineria sp. LJL83]